MSASLVGSEMCIRDRRRGARGAVATPPPERERSKALMAHYKRSEQLRACLLYTSDAADDM
eukprot:14714417-Alexandrium_andersonii.AAC.1